MCTRTRVRPCTTPKWPDWHQNSRRLCHDFCTWKRIVSVKDRHNYEKSPKGASVSYFRILWRSWTVTRSNTHNFGLEPKNTKWKITISHWEYSLLTFLQIFGLCYWKHIVPLSPCAPKYHSLSAFPLSNFTLTSPFTISLSLRHSPPEV